MVRIAGMGPRSLSRAFLAALALCCWACQGSKAGPGARCGNGVVEAGEQCDDANASNGDGCTATCQVETGWSCTGSPSACALAGLSEWTWVTGSDSFGASATGVKGLASAEATPWSTVARGASWVDGQGHLWHFGGFANLLGGPTGYLADLWKFDGSAWTWVGGPGTLDTPGSYGTLGVADAANWPGGRTHAASWVDGSGRFWLFGGGGVDAAGNTGNLNDLWRFDGSSWTWMGGSRFRDDPGVHGTLGVPSPSNIPEARLAATTWVDTHGDAWIFGGQGFMGGAYGQFNDLWRFNGTGWTWVSGSSGYDDAGSYGVQGVAAPSSAPPSRFGAAGWVDGGGALWLFGGFYESALGAIFGDLSDLWRFDGSAWTWMGGAQSVGAPTVFGQVGVADPTASPGARRECVAFTDAGGHFWLFAGGGYVGELDELWRFDGLLWTFMGGFKAAHPAGLYGTRGVAAPTNVPGGRLSAAGWVDAGGAFWVFGGYGIGRQASLGAMNDLWRYRPPP
jgi:cysteine-rich repeat protein